MGGRQHARMGYLLEQRRHLRGWVRQQNSERIRNLSMPQDKQQAIKLPKEGYDLGKTAMVGVARGVVWWKPGTPVTCKLVNRGNEPAKVSNSITIAHMIALN